jgi:hypothetical protein
MHGHGGKYELMLPQHILNNGLKKIKIEKVSHEIGFPKLIKIDKELGSHTTTTFPITVEGGKTERIFITYDMKEGIPKKCRLKTIIEHEHGTNKYIDEINVTFKS